MKNHDTEIYYQLSHPQKRIWYTEKINTNSPLNNIGGVVWIYQEINVKVMQKVINTLIEKNDGLRLRIGEKEMEPVQYVQEYQLENIDFWDFSNAKNSIKSYEAWSADMFKKPFHLTDSSLYYFAICKLTEREYLVFVKAHHIISDGWSMSLIQRHICEIYRKLLSSERYDFDDYSYLDYLAYEKKYLGSKNFAKNKTFWNSKFQDTPEEFLYKSTNHLEGARRKQQLAADISDKIRQFAVEQNISLNTFFIAVILIYIYKQTNNHDLVVGTPIYNRANRVQKEMIGMFTSTMPIRYQLDIGLTIREFMKSVNQELKLCILNQKYPYDLLLKDLELGKQGYDSLFKISVNYYKQKYNTDSMDGKVAVHEYYSGNQSYSLQLTVIESQEGNIDLHLDYKIIEYIEDEIAAMFDCIKQIANQFVSDQNDKIGNLSLMSQAEHQKKVYELNNTTKPYPQKTVHELFEEQVNRTPDQIALEFKETQVTYHELNERSNQLAKYLQEKGVGHQTIVAVMLTHSIELMIAILATLKTGAAYLPIDPEYPPERVNYILKDSKASIILTNVQMKDEIYVPGMMIQIDRKNLQAYSKQNLSVVHSQDDLAYVIYTSGTTGKPKGVMIEHRGLTNYIWWANHVYLKEKNEAMALYSSISFDLTVTSIFTPLISGSKIIIYDNEEEFTLYRILRENKVTVLKLTPAHLTLLKDQQYPDAKIKRFIVGGEDLKVNLAKEVSDCFHQALEIYNEYGPTETVVGCMIHKFDPQKDKRISVPIGRPADNVQLYLLNQELQPVPTGMIAELYISGDGVARGYLNRDELTAEKFIENPYIKGKRMYRTGDLARYFADGKIEYIGRVDQQVKIRGYRIELGEIEKCLLDNQAVKKAVVAYKEDSLGNKALNAYLVVDQVIEDVVLKQWLLKFLPQYMIPNNFVFMEKLPLTRNGKVNFERLPVPQKNEGIYVSYKTLAEKELVIIMQEVLGCQNISMDDSYYQLGGDSIKAIQISSKLKNRGFTLKVKDILTYGTIADIAAKMRANREHRDNSMVKCEGSVVNTPIIKWFFSQNFYNENWYNQQILLEYSGRIEAEKISLAIQKLIECHDALRMNYDRENGKLYYNDRKNEMADIFQQYDISSYVGEQRARWIKKLKQKSNAKIKLEVGSLFHVFLIVEAQNKQSLLFTIHHLIVDGISWRILLEDFMTILKQLEQNIEINMPAKTDSFQVWAESLQAYSKRDFNGEKEYWNTILNKEDLVDMSKDIVETSDCICLEVEQTMLKNLIEKPYEIYSINLNEVLIIALILTLSKINKEKEVVIEFEGHGREALDVDLNISRTVGWFTSMYPAYFYVEHDDLENNIKTLKEQYRKIPNQGFHYSILQYITKDFINKNKYIRFNFLGELENLIGFDKINITNIEFELNCDPLNKLTALLDFVVIIINKKLLIKVEYSKNRFTEEQIKEILDSYFVTLNLIIQKCAAKQSKEFTPSDFELLDISAEELSNIFI